MPENPLETIFGGGGEGGGGYLPPNQYMRSLEDTIYQDINNQMGTRGQKPQFGYKVGESGYSVRPTTKFEGYKPVEGYTSGPSYQEYNFSTPNLTGIADQNYAGIENSAIEGAKSGAKSGIEQGLSLMGRRGLGRGGLADMNVMGNAGTLGRDISNIRRDVGFQRARDLSEISKTQAQMDMERQARQASERQFGSQFNEGQRQYQAEFESGQRQFGSQLALQNATSERQQAIQEILNQYQIDAAMRAEQTSAYQSPLQQLLQLYTVGMGARNAPGQGSPGILGSLGGAAGGVGGLIGGIAAL